ncbi:MAG: hypothetical protein ACOYD4_03980 [Solirubrobacterales bacterium]
MKRNPEYATAVYERVFIDSKGKRIKNISPRRFKTPPPADAWKDDAKWAAWEKENIVPEFIPDTP